MVVLTWYKALIHAQEAAREVGCQVLASLINIVDPFNVGLTL